MFIQRISVDGFGVLSDLDLAALAKGLTVVHGANGSGKTTLVRFLTGMFQGFDANAPAPFCSAGTARASAGALDLQLEENVVELIRHARPGRDDRVALSLKEGEMAVLAQVRRRIQRIAGERLLTVFAPANESAHDLQRLFEFALSDGIELLARSREEDWLSERIERVRRERAELFAGTAPKGRIAELEGRCLEVQQRMHELADSDADEADGSAETLRLQIDQAARQIDWLHAELGAAQADLTECDDRIWNGGTKPCAVERESARSQSKQEIASLIPRINRLCAVLHDLAASRFEISTRMAELAGSATTGLPAGPSSSGEPRQAGRQVRLSGEFAELSFRRDELDRCEAELVRQIERLRQRHGELLNRRAPVSVSRDSVELRNGRQRQAELGSRVQQLRQSWWEALEKMRQLRSRLQEVQLKRQQLAELRRAELRREFAASEQDLADAREQWQSLTLLQQILQRTDEKLRTPQPSAVIAEASRLLKRMTCARYGSFRFDEPAGSLFVLDNAGEEVPISALSRGTLDQAALSFRLALCSEYARRGEPFPLVLDDVLADSDEQRLRRSVEVLVEYASSGQQVVVFTCRDHLADLFEAAGVSVRSLSPRAARTIPISEPARLVGPSATPAATAETGGEFHVELAKEGRGERRAGFRRIQPASPYWLELNSPLSLIPSISSQMLRRLAAVGVRDVGDLIDLDPLNVDVPLEGIQVPVSLLRTWQAEGRLLALVPDLTGRDAQLLVSAGYVCPAQLADADFEQLWQQVDSARCQRNGEPKLSWLTEFTTGPDRAAVRRWVEAAGNSRSYEQARQSAEPGRPEGLDERRRRRRRQRRDRRSAGPSGRTRHAG